MKILYRNALGNLTALEADALSVMPEDDDVPVPCLYHVVAEVGEYTIPIVLNKDKREADSIFMQLYETGRYLP